MEVDKVECIFIDISNKNAKSFLVGCFYRPPEGSKFLPKDFNALFRELLIKVNNLSYEAILMGDLNADYMKSSNNKDLKQIIAAQGFDQLITKATRVTKDTSTLIDVILTNRRENISTSNVFPLGISDHDLIGCVRKVNHRKFTPRTITCQNFTNYDHIKMNQELSEIDFTKIYESNNVNHCWNVFKNEIMKVFNKHAPIISKTVKVRFCPWLTVELKAKMNEKHRLLCKARRTKSDEDWANFKRARNYLNNSLNYTKQ